MTAETVQDDSGPASRRKLAAQAAEARGERVLFWGAVVLLVFYNAIGALDIMTTEIGLRSGVAAESNPVIGGVMAMMADQWVWGKLVLQLAVSAMILWFPHRVVLGIFFVAVLINAVTVANNFAIIGGF